MNSQIDLNNLKYFSQDNNMNNITIGQFKHNIEYLKDIIKDGNIIIMEKYDVTDIISSIVNCKTISNDYENHYNELIKFLEIYNDQYKQKYDDLLIYILENMTDEKKELLLKDTDGNPILIVKPMLKRQYNTYISNLVLTDILYTLVSHIIIHIENIFQYEDHFINNDNNNKLKKDSGRGIVFK